MENTHLLSVYGEDFMSPIDDDLPCLICQHPLREPVLTRYGHRFCRQCLEQQLARFAFVSLLDGHSSMQVTIYSSFKHLLRHFWYKRACNESAIKSLKKHNIMKGKHLALNKKLIVLLISTRDLDNALVRFAHSWNIFQHSKRNFVLPRGHLMSCISMQLYFCKINLALIIRQCRHLCSWM